MEISGGGVVGSVKKTCLCLSSEWRPSPSPRIRSVSLVPRSIDFSDKSHLTYYYHPNVNVKLVAASSKNKKKNSIARLSTNQKLKLLKSFADSSNKLSLEEAGAAFLNEVDKVRAEEKQEKKQKKMKKQKRKSESESESSESASERECGEQLQVIGNRERHDYEEEMNTRVRVDVCMGNKCKTSGGESILGEFQSQISSPNAVVACKCMGKCKSAPNVRLTLTTEDSDFVTNPLYIGVGLEDVTSIISSFVSQQHNNNIAFPAASP